MIIGVTGSFGSGKTTVARMFKVLGAKIIDADIIARSVIRPGTRIYKKIIATFGRGILKKDKKIDRAKLANIVFNNKERLKLLNEIVHPPVIRIIKGRLQVKSKGAIVLDAPLLIEAGLLNLVDKLIVVKTDRKLQIKRLLDKSLLSKSEISKRIKAQVSLRKKIRLADFVIDNSATLKTTKKQAQKIWAELQLQRTH